jgi:arylsulfatase
LVFRLTASRDCCQVPPRGREGRRWTARSFLFLLADNVGYGAYGGGELRGAPTPRIDQLAAESLKLTQFLVEPGCTPSRGLLAAAVAIIVALVSDAEAMKEQDPGHHAGRPGSHFATMEVATRASVGRERVKSAYPMFGWWSKAAELTYAQEPRTDR